MSTTAPAADLIDDERLTAWLDAEGLEPGQELSYELLTGGRSNVMFTVHRGASTWVLRRPAKVAIERADEGMRREYRILAALAGTDVPHPAVVALCDDHSVLGCTFYLMARVDGVGPFPPPAGFDTPSGRAAIAYGLVDALAALHRVDWKAAGLGDLGRPEGFHQRQVSRWGKQLASYQGREVPGAEKVMAWLEEHAPTEYDPVLMHADYHMLNVLVDEQNPGQVTAILDWATTRPTTCSSSTCRRPASPPSSTGRPPPSATRCSTWPASPKCGAR
jgi:aminoglycoside phosphotransferase (APT) family kinase protein